MQKDMCMPLQQTATRCNTLQGVTTHHDASHDIDTQTCAGSAFQETCAYLYNKYHHTATHINARQRTWTHCTTDRDTHTCVEGAFIWMRMLQCASHEHCNTLKHTATHAFNSMRIFNVKLRQMPLNKLRPWKIQKLEFLGTSSRYFESKSQFEFVPRDTEKSEFLPVLEYGGWAFSVEIVFW